MKLGRLYVSWNQASAWLAINEAGILTLQLWRIVLEYDYRPLPNPPGE